MRPRSVADRRKYAGRPHAYVWDLLGLELTAQQEEALALMQAETRLLIRSGNNLGKTFLLAAFAIYLMDAEASLPDADLGLEEQGARVLLPGPDHPTVFSTVYSEMTAHLQRAQSRGFEMPGRFSTDSVLWRVRPKWEVEAFSPPPSTGLQIAHTASGRHHRNQHALIEEGAGVREALWKATEGMCSGDGNRIISTFNPDRPLGPAYERAESGAWRVHQIDAFDHPNVRRRYMVVPAAISFHVIDSRVRDVRECRDRGTYPAVAPDLERGDFLYALPERDAEEVGGREDGIAGHPLATVHVYRPTPAFEAQVRGAWPRSMETGLFDPGAWDAAVRRWNETPEPLAVPDRIGIDVAREGDDDTCYAPSWGEDGETLLRAWAEAEADVDDEAKAALKARRARVGEVQVAPKARGPEVAEYIARDYGRSPWVVDESGVGASVLDHARDVFGLDVAGVSFGSSAPDRLPGEHLCENVRAALAVRLSMLLDRGLVDLPPDPELRKEAMAHRLIPGRRTAEDSVRGERGKVRKESVRLLEKAKVKKAIGRSPDRFDAVILSVWRAEVAPEIFVG